MVRVSKKSIIFAAAFCETPVKYQRKEMPKNLVIVESPAKAKTIEKFLGEDYKVTSSYGHIRDLKQHDFSVDVNNHFEPLYEIPEDKQKLVEDLKKAAKKAETVWLASDEDREGEAISWHLYEVLGLKPENTRRIVFHEITKNAILEAIKQPRDIDVNLVNAQQARRVLDRIVGFELSPILWKKVKPSLSAGRVQSVAVRLIVEREREIQNFKAETSFRVKGTFAAVVKGQTQLFDAEYNQRFRTEEEARRFLEVCKTAGFRVADIQKKPFQRFPAPPFTTSTLQQEAARKLHFSVSQTMSIAQRLYESGFITYMRTDSVNLSTLCLGASKQQILDTMGKEYLHTRNYVTHSKGAQEAHEAIRPTYMDRMTITGAANDRRLYELIWKRTIASQMAEAEMEKTQIDIEVKGQPNLFTATGEVIKFDGFLKVYMESSDDETADEEDASRLPAVKVGESLQLDSAEAAQRFTQQPLRYTEASLVKKMEELGIGRPSTYAPTVSTILNREYVEKCDRGPEKREVRHLRLKNGKITASTATENCNNDRGKLIPTDIGVVVNDFLETHFPQIMSYNFTAKVEEDFDLIAEGKEKWNDSIGKFYDMFEPLVKQTREERSEKKTGERELGTDPKSGRRVSVKISKYGPIVQIGDSNDEIKPLFASLRKGQSIQTITLEDALHLFDLPKTLGEYEGDTVSVGIGRFGPYIHAGSLYVSLPKGKEPLDVTLEDAVALIREKQDSEAKKVLRTFDEDASLQVLNGRWGPYLACNGKNYHLAKSVKTDELTYEEAKKIMEAADSESKDSKKKTRYSRR